MSRAWTALLSALAGSAASIGLWVVDAVSLSRLQFAGVSDPEAQERLIAATGRAVALLELKLLAIHALGGLAFGLLVFLALPEKVTRGSGRRAVAAAALLTLLAQGLAFFAMMGHYPQLYADRWWLAGGLRAVAQRTVTHVLGPPFFDVLLAATVAALVLAAAARLARAPGLARTVAPWRWVLAGVGGLGVVLLAGLSLLQRPRGPVTDSRPDVLILASDSLRRDRLESREVMPYSSSLVPGGTLFRYAFTPVARTFPSWVSVLTGNEPRHTGVRTMFPSMESRVDLGPTFASVLRDSGYRTFVVSDFAGDIFPRFPSGFEAVDTPTLTADALAQSTVLSAHGFSLPLLRLAFFRRALPEWRNLASLSDPEWLVDRAIAQIRGARGRPFLGLVFFSTSHFPYVAPYPDYLWGAGDYRGPFLYHAPPVLADRAHTPEDIDQVRARYDGSLRAIDRATRRLVEALRGQGTLARTVLVVTGDHGEELYEEPGIAGHGDTIGAERSQSVPILLRGPGVPARPPSNEQVRLHDLAATVLSLALPSPAPATFGDGRSLFVPGPRPVCVETGIWFWPRLPEGLRGHRLEYPGIAELLQIDPASRELVLRPDQVAMVETAKRRGLVLGARLWEERLTPEGHEAALRVIPGIDPAHEDVALGALFEERCVAGDPALLRFYDDVVYRRP